MPAGRPSDYKPEYCELLIEYFSKPPYREVTKQIVNKLGGISEVTVTEATDFPTLAGFAIKIGVHRDTIRNWTDQDPEFFSAYKRARDFQENYIAVNGLKGLINPAFGIFTAKNVLGWRDRNEMSHTFKPLLKENEGKTVQELISETEALLIEAKKGSE